VIKVYQTASYREFEPSDYSSGMANFATQISQNSTANAKRSVCFLCSKAKSGRPIVAHKKSSRLLTDGPTEYNIIRGSDCRKGDMTHYAA